MAIRVRQGIEKDFDPYKLLPGEWAVSLDKKYVYMCFSAGEVRRMATYEAFEEDMVQIEKILAACENIQAAVEAFEKLAERHAAQADTYSVESESWAVGGTGTREEENTNNSKYYSQQSETQANRAKNEADRAASIANIDIATTEKAGIIKGNAEEFSISADGKLSLTSSYEEQETLEEIDGTEDKKTLFGKIAGAVRELIAHTGSKGIHYTLTNNLLANVSGTALDAVQGKALDDRITELNNSLYQLDYDNKVNISALSNYTPPSGGHIVGKAVSGTAGHGFNVYVKGITIYQAGIALANTPVPVSFPVSAGVNHNFTGSASREIYFIPYV